MTVRSCLHSNHIYIYIYIYIYIHNMIQCCFVCVSMYSVFINVYNVHTWFIRSMNTLIYIHYGCKYICVHMNIHAYSVYIQQICI